MDSSQLCTRLPSGLLKRLKLRAFKEEKTIQLLVEELLERGLKGSREQTNQVEEK